MHCALFDAGRCRSCQWIEQPLDTQLAAKMSELRQLLEAFPVGEWDEPVSGPEQGFRNKAKMVVSGSVEKPLLGMLHRDGTPVDLTGCPLYPASFYAVFAALKPFIARAGLTPYNVARKRGELKYLLLTESTLDGGLMLRFVLRSTTKLEQLRAALPALLAQLPQLSVVTANIQPVHMAIMEGEEEIWLTQQRALAENFNGVPLWIRPQSFFQTNPTVASALYAAARDWVRALPVNHMWDLFLRRRRIRAALRDARHDADRYRNCAGSDSQRQRLGSTTGPARRAFSGAGFDRFCHRSAGRAGSGARQPTASRHWGGAVRLSEPYGARLHHLFQL